MKNCCRCSAGSREMATPMWKIVAILLVVFIAILSVAFSARIMKREIAEKRELPENLDWWQTTIFYQVYPRSFKDTDGDGVGDLKGIAEKAEYFKDTGIGAVWLSPFYESPMADFGYDISDFTQVDQIFGTLDDFKTVVAAYKKHGVRLVVDLVPNHSSRKHEWFQKSIKKIDPYTDYYIWKDPKGWTSDGKPIPPNNWISIFEGSAWEYVEERKQFYYHNFAVEQPDMNYRNPQLKQEIKDVMTFWLDLGIDGFRVDSTNYLIEDDRFLDEPVINNVSIIAGYPAKSSVLPVYTGDQPGTYEVLAEFRELLDSYSRKDNSTRVFLSEAYTSLNNTLAYYGNKTHPIAHIAFNFNLITDLNATSNAHDLDAVVHKWMDNVGPEMWPNWVIGNHDRPRVASRFVPELVDGMNMMLLLLPGTPTTYNGEEIGMRDTIIRWDQTVDKYGLNVGPELYQKYSRDPPRTPFQWDSSPYAGFSNTTNKTWLPVNSNYWHLNLDMEMSEELSHYNIYKRLVSLRSQEEFTRGDLSTYVFSDWIFGFTRTHQNENSLYLIIINLGSEEEFVRLLEKIPDISDEVTVQIASINSEHKDGNTLQATGFTMRPKSSLVLESQMHGLPTNAREVADRNKGAFIGTCLPIMLLMLAALLNFR